MNFAFSEEQDAFRDTLRRFFEERWSSAEVRALAATPEGFDAAIWKQLGEELGLVGIALPESVGGQGFGFLELGIALEEMGRQLAGGPFFASACLGARAIHHAANEAQRQALLPAIAAGSRLAALAFSERGAAPDADDITAVCRRQGDGWVVSGDKPGVLAGAQADLFVVAARESGSSGRDGVALLVVEHDAPGVTMTPSEPLDLSRPQADLVLRDAPAQRLGGDGSAWPALARTLDEATIALAAEAIGAAARCLELAVEYAKQRVQFARPIGSFQAVKHKVAEVMLELETARSAAYWSWWVADQEPCDAAALVEAASVAKSACSEALTRAASENLQIHGGVGFTWEFDCHLYYRRAKASELLLGDPTWHRARLAQQLGF